LFSAGSDLAIDTELVVRASGSGKKIAGNKAFQSKTATEMADELSIDLGRNSVTYRTVNKSGHIDLRGDTHWDKVTERAIETPHVQEYNLHKGPDGKMSTYRKSEVIRLATKADIRVAKRLADQQRIVNNLNNQNEIQKSIRRGVYP